MSVNKLWTLIYNNQEDRVGTLGLVYYQHEFWWVPNFINLTLAPNQILMKQWHMTNGHMENILDVNYGELWTVTDSFVGQCM